MFSNSSRFHQIWSYDVRLQSHFKKLIFLLSSIYHLFMCLQHTAGLMFVFFSVKLNDIDCHWSFQVVSYNLILIVLVNGFVYLILLLVLRMIYLIPHTSSWSLKIDLKVISMRCNWIGSFEETRSIFSRSNYVTYTQCRSLAILIVREQQLCVQSCQTKRYQKTDILFKKTIPMTISYC